VNANARRNEIIRILYSRQNQPTTARYLAECFEVSEKTIRRDIEVLISEEHLAIDMFQGNGGGIKYSGIKKYGRILSNEQVNALKRSIQTNPNDIEILQSIIDTYG
jgi:predicted DNA-binding transcriptional regulator YafY